METLKPHEIALHLGLDPTHARGCQDWVPDTHAHLTISELVHGPNAATADIHPFRVIDKASGNTHTRIPEGFVIDHDKVKTIYADTLAMNQKKNLEIVPLVMAAIPELDPDRAHEFAIIGQRIYSIVDGRLINPQPIPSHPIYSVSGSNVVVDASDMADHHQKAIAKALADKAKVIAPLAKG